MAWALSQFPQTGKMGQITASCSNKMVVKNSGSITKDLKHIHSRAKDFFRHILYIQEQSPISHILYVQVDPASAERLSHSSILYQPEHLLDHRLLTCDLFDFCFGSVQFLHANHLVLCIFHPQVRVSVHIGMPQLFPSCIYR